MAGSERVAAVRDAVKRPLWWRHYATPCGLWFWSDLVVEADLGLRYAAVVPVIRGAGGVVTDWNGLTHHPEPRG